jgi:hypothetical protein
VDILTLSNDNYKCRYFDPTVPTSRPVTSFGQNLLFCNCLKIWMTSNFSPNCISSYLSLSVNEEPKIWEASAIKCSLYAQDWPPVQGPVLWFIKHFCQNIVRKYWRFYPKHCLSMQKMNHNIDFQENAKNNDDNIDFGPGWPDWANFRPKRDCLL